MTVLPRAPRFSHDVVVVGGCGHVGLPLAIALADRGAAVLVYDINEAAVDRVNAGRLPFDEPGAASRAAPRCWPTGRLRATTDPRRASATAEHVVVVVGTPVDEHLNPDPQRGPAGASSAAPTTCATASSSSCAAPSTRASPRWSSGCSAGTGVDVDVAFCPERIAEGKAMTELFELPQIVVRPHADAAASGPPTLFGQLTEQIVAAGAGGGRAGQAVHQHLALHQVRRRQPVLHDRQRLRRSTSSAIRAGDDRTTTRGPPTCPAPGFAAGPCLFKDTMQLAAFNNNNFALGHASMMVNEGLPLYLVARLEQQLRPGEMTVGILGMAFKGEQRRHPLEPVATSSSGSCGSRPREVLCTDPYVTVDPDLVPARRGARARPTCWSSAPRTRPTATSTADVPVVDIWNLLGDGVRV